MSALLRLLTLQPAGDDRWQGPGAGPQGKRSFGGLFAAQSLAAACATVDAAKRPTNLHMQFLRGGDAGDDSDYQVERVYDGRTAAARRVQTHQHDRLLTTATVSFSAPLPGPEHGIRQEMPRHPDTLDRTGPPGPAPSLPLDELDIRVDDEHAGGEFVRRLWWRATVVLPEDPLIHTMIAVYVTDLYGLDPILQVHGSSMADRTHRSGTTDSSIWLHQPLRADQWNLLESRSPAASRGRGVMTASLLRSDGVISATLVQEGLIADR